MQEHDIGWAVYQLKSGRLIRRSGWNGKNMHLYLEEMGERNMPRHNSKTGKITFEKIADILPHIVMYTAQGNHQPGWLASQADLLATDWEIAE